MHQDSATLKAINLWQSIIGVDTETRIFNMGNIHHHSEFEQLREALELDPSEITANLLLGNFAKRHFRNTHVTQEELLERFDEVNSALDKSRELVALLERPEVAGPRDLFIANVRSALEQYDAAGREEVQNVLSNHETMAYLRRDALRSMANLSVHQFLDGEPEAPSVKPVYYRFVYQWFNVNSMLESAAQQAPGVSLNLIRDPNDFQSYFCFSIRNGARLFVLSDVPDNAHPMQPMLSRRPDREMDQRISKNWFPYELMGLAYSEDDGRLYFDRSDAKSLVVGQAKALPLKPISALEAHQLVWLTMMFGLIVDRFWRRGHTEQVLSYTSEMVRVQDKMIEAANKSALPVKNYAKIDVVPLTLDDVKSATAGKNPSFGKPATNTKTWLEERYAPLISEESLNLISSPERRHVLSIADGMISDTRKSEMSISHSRYDEQQKSVQLQKLPSTFFGTKEKIEADRLYVARYNYAKQIDIHAENEFKARRKEVSEWYKAKVNDNASTLKTWVGDQILWMENTGEDQSYSSRLGRGFQSYSATEGSEKRHFRSFATPVDLADDYERRAFIGFGTHVIGEFRKHLLCCVNETKASYAFAFCPANAEEVAVVAGCSVADLPDVLQNYKLGERDSGNHLLDRIDPIEWVLKDPWAELDLRVVLPLSKRGFDKMVKEGVRPPYWEKYGYKGPLAHQRWREKS